MEMNLFVLDKDFHQVGLVDEYESFIWTDRYNEPGDFEIYTSPFSKAYEFLKQDYYVIKPDSDHVMIIEAIEITSDAEHGDHLKVTGRSLESILDRRIIWKQTDFDNKTIGTIVKTLLNDAIISPSDSNRKISNFIYEEATIANVTDQVISVQYTGDNLLDVISDICETYEIGFKITLNSSNQFVFTLYNGSNRTYAQTRNPYVLFSPSFDNIINSDYLESQSSLKNVTLIAGEGEGSDRKTQTVYGNQVENTYKFLADGTFDTSVFSVPLKYAQQDNSAVNGASHVQDGYLECTMIGSPTSYYQGGFSSNSKLSRNTYDALVINMYYTKAGQSGYGPRFGVTTSASQMPADFISKTELTTVSEGLQTLELSLADYNSQSSDGYFAVCGSGNWKVTGITFYKYVRSGLDRRELYTDARDISSTTEDGTLTNAKYNQLLRQRGLENLASYPIQKIFDGQVESSQLFVYNKDFYMGDIVQIENEFGIEGTARITEFIYSESSSGIEMYPTFEAIN